VENNFAPHYLYIPPSPQTRFCAFVSSSVTLFFQRRVYLTFQVSGHASLMTTDDRDIILKPLIPHELNFYRNMAPEMRPFTPDFKGKLVNISISHLVLHGLVSFIIPRSLWVMGSVSWDSSACIKSNLYFARKHKILV